MAKNRRSEHYHQNSYRRGTGAPGKQISRDPHYVLAEALSAALDPSTAPGKVRTLADMTPEDRAKMLALYQPPKK